MKRELPEFCPLRMFNNASSKALELTEWTDVCQIGKIPRYMPCFQQKDGDQYCKSREWFLSNSREHKLTCE